MGELDWLDRGHGGGEGLLPMIKGSTVATSADRVSIRSVLRGPDAAMRPRRRTRRRTKALVGWLLYCCTAVGGTAAAFTVRDTLFPSLGGETSRALWVGLTPDHPLPSDTTVAPAAQPGTLFEDSTAPDDSTATSVEDEESTSSASLPDDSTTVESLDDNGSDTRAPTTGTTVVRATPSGTTATTVDDHGAGNPPASASSTPSSVEASAPSSSVPGSTDDGHQNGKGGGGGGSGGGGGTSNP